MDDEVLIFECAGIRFGLPASAVVEVLRAVQIAPAPQTPAALLGMISLRGDLVAVINAPVRLGLAAVPLHPSHQFIVMAADEDRFALHVDRAIDVISPQRSAQPDQPTVDLEDDMPANSDEGPIQMVVQTEYGIVPVLDPNSIPTAELRRAIRNVTSTGVTETNR